MNPQTLAHRHALNPCPGFVQGIPSRALHPTVWLGGWSAPCPDRWSSPLVVVNELVDGVAWCVHDGLMSWSIMVGNGQACHVWWLTDDGRGWSMLTLQRKKAGLCQDGVSIGKRVGQPSIFAVNGVSMRSLWLVDNWFMGQTGQSSWFPWVVFTASTHGPFN